MRFYYAREAERDALAFCKTPSVLLNLESANMRLAIADDTYEPFAKVFGEFYAIGPVRLHISPQEAHASMAHYGT